MSEITEKFSNKEQASSIAKLILSDDQLAQLIALSDANRSDESPIPADISPLPANNEVIKILRASGWLRSDEETDSPELNKMSEDALKAILTPKTTVQIVLGSPKEMAVTHLYSAREYTDNSLTIYTHRESEGVHVINPGQSPSDISDALLAQLLNGPHLEGLNFDLSLNTGQYLTYLTILDLIYSRELEAKLNASSFPVTNFNFEDIWYRFTEIRLGEDLLWSSVLIPYLFPNFDPNLTKKQVKSSLSELADEGLLTPVSKATFQPSDFTLALAKGLLPIISFGACTISTGNGDGLQIGFVIGLNVNLVINTSIKGEKKTIQFNGMDGIQLSRLLFEIGLPISTEEGTT